MSWKNRIVDHGEVDPRTLKANPSNWRLHPTAQRKAMAQVLDKVGMVDDVIVNRQSGLIVDGHLRVELAVERGEKTIPVKYVDLDVQEEALVLTTFDPLGGMARPDQEKLDSVIADIREGHDNLFASIGYKLDLLGSEAGREKQAEGPLQLVPEEQRETPLVEFINGHQLVLVMVSGGKDSCALGAWAEENVTAPMKWVYCNTGIDWPGCEQLVKEQAKICGADLDIVGPRTDETWRKALVQYGMPSFANLWCNKMLKLNHIDKYIVKQGLGEKGVCRLLGVRRSESQRRKTYPDRVDSGSRTNNAFPILEMTDDEVWAIVEERGLPKLPAYAFLKRTGCFCCPNHGLGDWAKIRENMPEVWARCVQYAAVASKNDFWRATHSEEYLRKMCSGMDHD